MVVIAGLACGRSGSEPAEKVAFARNEVQAQREATESIAWLKIAAYEETASIEDLYEAMANGAMGNDRQVLAGFPLDVATVWISANLLEWTEYEGHDCYVMRGEDGKGFRTAVIEGHGFEPSHMEWDRHSLASIPWVRGLPPSQLPRGDAVCLWLWQEMNLGELAQVLEAMASNGTEFVSLFTFNSGDLPPPWPIGFVLSEEFEKGEVWLRLDRPEYELALLEDHIGLPATVLFQNGVRLSSQGTKIAQSYLGQGWKPGTWQTLHWGGPGLPLDQPMSEEQKELALQSEELDVLSLSADGVIALNGKEMTRFPENAVEGEGLKNFANHLSRVLDDSLLTGDGVLLEIDGQAKVGWHDLLLNFGSSKIALPPWTWRSCFVVVDGSNPIPIRSDQHIYGLILSMWIKEGEEGLMLELPSRTWRFGTKLSHFSGPVAYVRCPANWTVARGRSVVHQYLDPNCEIGIFQDLEWHED